MCTYNIHYTMHVHTCMCLCVNQTQRESERETETETETEKWREHRSMQTTFKTNSNS